MIPTELVMVLVGLFSLIFTFSMLAVILDSITFNGAWVILALIIGLILYFRKI